MAAELRVEHFGPTTVIATAGLHSYPKILQRLEGTLTATLGRHGGDPALPAAGGVAGLRLPHGLGPTARLG
jgi:hypothetical protein